MKVPSPCIKVCKFKNAGHCVGCGMTKKQKKKFKRLDGRKAKLAFVEALRLRQIAISLKTNWERAYRRRCTKKGIRCPLDRVPPLLSNELDDRMSSSGLSRGSIDQQSEQQDRSSALCRG